MKCIVSVDIGGTEIKIGKFINDRLIQKQTIKTNVNDNGEYILSDIFNIIDQMIEDDEMMALGIGVPGPVINGIVLGAQNLKWKEKNIKQIVLDRYPTTLCTVLNDANAATLGEMMYGGGIGYQNFVFMTIGTGIGGGIVIDNELIEGSTGSCGEIGHIRVGFSNERKCTCGLFDCVEQYASATGIVITAYQTRLNRETKLNDTTILTSKMIFDLAKAGDVVALEVIDKMVEKLSTALSQVANTINPEAFVIGGGVSKAGEFLIQKLEKRFKELAFFSVRDVKFELAKLGNDAGIFGNYYRALQAVIHAN